MLNINVKKLMEILFICNEILQTKPTYTDTQEEIIRLEGKKELAADIVTILQDVRIQ